MVTPVRMRVQRGSVAAVLSAVCECGWVGVCLWVGVADEAGDGRREAERGPLNRPGQLLGRHRTWALESAAKEAESPSDPGAQGPREPKQRLPPDPGGTTCCRAH